MMIKIGKTKIILDRYDGCLPEKVEEIPINDISRYLGEPLEIEEGVTFKRIFEIFIMNRDIFNRIFYSFTRGFNIDLYIEDFLKESKEVEGDTSIEFLEVYRVFEHYIFNGEDDWSYYYGFHGKGKKDEHGVTNYGLLGLSLSELKNLPIKLDNELKITIDNGKSIEKVEKVQDKYQTLHKAQIPITLFNFIGAILFEITFYGTPANTKEFVESLKETTERVRSGEEKTYELLKDEEGKFYFIDDEGNKEYLFKEDDE